MEIVLSDLPLIILQMILFEYLEEPKEVVDTSMKFGIFARQPKNVIYSWYELRCANRVLSNLLVHHKKCFKLKNPDKIRLFFQDPSYRRRWKNLIPSYKQLSVVIYDVDFLRSHFEIYSGSCEDLQQDPIGSLVIGRVYPPLKSQQSSRDAISLQLSQFSETLILWSINFRDKTGPVDWQSLSPSVKNIELHDSELPDLEMLRNVSSLTVEMKSLSRGLVSSWQARTRPRMYRQGEEQLEEQHEDNNENESDEDEEYEDEENEDDEAEDDASESDGDSLNKEMPPLTPFQRQLFEESNPPVPTEKLELHKLVQAKKIKLVSIPFCLLIPLNELPDSIESLELRSCTQTFNLNSLLSKKRLTNVHCSECPKLQHAENLKNHLQNTFLAESYLLSDHLDMNVNNSRLRRRFKVCFPGEKNDNEDEKLLGEILKSNPNPDLHDFFLHHSSLESLLTLDLIRRFQLAYHPAAIPALDKFLMTLIIPTLTQAYRDSQFPSSYSHTWYTQDHDFLYGDLIFHPFHCLEEQKQYELLIRADARTFYDLTNGFNQFSGVGHMRVLCTYLPDLGIWHVDTGSAFADKCFGCGEVFANGYALCGKHC